jgi:predicted secreted protein
MAATTLTRQHQGQTITAVVGSVLAVTLDESPTTGYTWAPAEASSALPLTSDDFAPAAAGGTGGGSVGGGGLRRLQFKVAQPGEHALDLLLMRPWEGPGAAVDQFHITVQAHAA